MLPVAARLSSDVEDVLGTDSCGSWPSGATVLLRLFAGTDDSRVVRSALAVRGVNQVGLGHLEMQVPTSWIAVTARARSPVCTVLHGTIHNPRPKQRLVDAAVVKRVVVQVVECQFFAVIYLAVPRPRLCFVVHNPGRGVRLTLNRLIECSALATRLS